MKQDLKTKMLDSKALRFSASSCQQHINYFLLYFLLRTVNDFGELTDGSVATEFQMEGRNDKLRTLTSDLDFGLDFDFGP